MALTHHRWERSGRTLTTEKPNQYCYKGGLGQQNVSLGNGDYAPYVWDAAKKVLQFAHNKVEFNTNGIDFYLGPTKKATIAFHPEIDDGGWQRKPGIASGLTVVENETTDATDTIEVSYKVATADNDSRVSLKVGGSSDVRFTFSIKSVKGSTSTQRLTLETDLTEKHTEIKSNYAPEKNKPEKTVGVDFGDCCSKWLYDEVDDHQVVDLDSGKESKVIIASGSYLPGEEKIISPTTFGPSSVPADSSDCDQDAGGSVNIQGYDADGDVIGYAGSAEHNLGVRFQNVTCSGTADNGCKIEMYQNFAGDPPASNIKGIDEADPAIWNDSPDDGPDDRNQTTASVAWTPADNNDAYQDTPEIKTIIQELINSYTYTGSQAMAFAVNNTGQGSGYLIQFNDIGRSATEPSKLTIAIQ
jgi:hypothetical protein